MMDNLHKNDEVGPSLFLAELQDDTVECIATHFFYAVLRSKILVVEIPGEEGL